MHIAIIMDGNGRWAKKRFLPVIEGHRKGSKNLRNICEVASKHGVSTLTVYAFSTENWLRPKQEISDLMDLLRYYLKNEIETLNKLNIKLEVMGDIKMLSPDIQNLIKVAKSTTKNNTAMTLNIALSYGSKHEITQAVKLIAQKAANNEIEPDNITESYLQSHFYSPNLPDVDILIRTGGEYRLSNFMLWQASYAELFFSNSMWPDFTEKELVSIIAEYHSRERRFGTRLEA